MITTVYVLTPCINAAATIDRTIMSVVSQSGLFRLRYHIQDGGSSDGTLAKIEAWQQRLSSGNFPTSCDNIQLTYASEQDTGMYDALVKGFARLDAMAADFMTWINADDILMPGAVALAAGLANQFSTDQLSWFGGSVCIVCDDISTLTYDRVVPYKSVSMGLCDGINWEFIQQEGTFFRQWLWEKVDPIKNIAGMKLAGDWNLWRLMAMKAKFTQTINPLGCFRVSDSQLSLTQRDRYMSEIQEILSLEDRTTLMKAFCNDSPILRRKIISTNIRSSCFEIVESSADSEAQQRLLKIFETESLRTESEQVSNKAPHNDAALPALLVQQVGNIYKDVASLVKHRPDLIAFDEDWQHPAITEKHAYLRFLHGSSQNCKGVIYVAYPWATLIDKLNNNTHDSYVFLERFEQFCDLLPKNVKKVTVCQHIYARRFQHLFRQADISIIFWSHATHDDVACESSEEVGLNFLPFPLYPVQIPLALLEAESQMDETPRKHLFSFIGARANQYYLTQTRNWILELLADDPRGLILGRDGWHYERIVYERQIRGISIQDSVDQLIDKPASDLFRESLQQSTFSLCPSGSGPNSIRLWESIGAGSIPVILSETWAPPGDLRLWQMAAVFCKEDPDEISALPDRLEMIAANPERLSQMRHAMRQIWLLYGPQGFITDVQEFMLSEAQAPVVDIGEAFNMPYKGFLVDSALIERNEENLLRCFASELLLDPIRQIERLENDTRLVESLERACKNQQTDSGLLLNYESAFKFAKLKYAKRSQFAPLFICKNAPKVCLFGRHSHRTPLSYAPFRALIGSRLEFVGKPQQADIVISGFNIDLCENGEILLPLHDGTSKPNFLILSEEPLWDITWGSTPLGQQGCALVGDTEISYSFLGHENSSIFDFERIPYFVLTNNTFPVRYANLISRFTQRSPREMLAMWHSSAVRSAFFLEKRKGECYSLSFPERDVRALSAYRTEVAELSDGPGVLRVGKGWDNELRRQDLPDWHLDKLAHLDGRTRVLSAFENVHQRLYITEKIFDAFAVGAVPAFWAGPQHRVFDLIPPESMINCYDLTAQRSAEQISSFTLDISFAQAWLDTAAQLVSLFKDRKVIHAERRRVVEATLKCILEL